MKLLSKKFILTAGALLFASCQSSTSSNEQIAQTPPMGWNSFDSYGVYIPQEAAIDNLEEFAVKLKPHGYEYFVIDNGWFGEYKLKPGTNLPNEKHAHDIAINEYGHFMPSETYFKDGLKPIIDRSHELGIKFGIHLMRGIPRKAYDLNLPIKGTNYTARDIANTDPKENCTWCKYNYAVDMTKPGAQEWYDGLMQHMADMGVDMIKYDDIVPHPDEVAAVAKAIKKTGRPMMLSLSPGNNAPQNEEAVKSFKMGNMLRVTADIWDEQKGLDQCFEAWRKWSGYSTPGFWIDMDMIPFGQLQLMSPAPAVKEKKQKAVRLAGHGYKRWSQFSTEQMYTFMTMRALSASPLMMGGDLPTLDDFSLELITNKDMLACNQNGVQGTLEFEGSEMETWVTPNKMDSSKGWIGVFNRGTKTRKIKLSKHYLGLDSLEGLSLRDVWGDKMLQEGDWVTIPANGCLFVAYGAK